MNKEERLQNIKDIINVVFRAEHEVNDGVMESGEHKGLSWQQVFQNTSESKDVRDKTADEYVETIACRIMENGYLRFESDNF